MATSDGPISIGKVTLVVNDLDKMSDYYQQILGLHPIARDGESTVLGAGTRALIELRKDTHATFAPQEAGLFHTAFLLPNRADLANWLTFAAQQGLRLDGASDHLVSEAVYLTDPEGNGVEIYVDRPRDQWQINGDEIKMTTEYLDIDGLLKQSNQSWTSAPDDTVIGHVHLQVGDISKADGFMTQTLGMTRTFAMPSASWYGSGGYHHQLAANIWNSRGAGQRSANATGLADVELKVASELEFADSLHDPWGTTFTITKV